MGKQAIENATRINAFAVSPKDLILIGRDTKDGPEHPLYDSRALGDPDPTLVRRIKLNGFRSVISVVKDGDRILVAAGRRRVIAAREAERQLQEEGSDLVLKAKCIVEKGSDPALFDLMVGENEHRVNYTPMQRAKLMLRAVQMGDEQSTADLFRCSVQTVHNYLALLDLHPEVQAKIESGEISASAAAKLADLPKVEQPGALAEVEAEGDKVTADTVAAGVARAQGEDTHKAPGKRLIKRLVRSQVADPDGPDALHPEFLRALQWVLGDLEIPELGK